MASHKGNDAYNQQLSLERVLRVRDYMISQGVKTLMPVEAVGESEANPTADDDERDRAVRLTIEPELRPRPIIVKKKPAPPPPIFVPPIIPPPIGGSPPSTFPTDPSTQNFRIRMVKAANAGFGKVVSGDLITFEILDVDNNIHAFYNYQGAAVGVGTPVSVHDGGAVERLQDIRAHAGDPVRRPRELRHDGGRAVHHQRTQSAATTTWCEADQHQVEHRGDLGWGILNRCRRDGPNILRETLQRAVKVVSGRDPSLSRSRCRCIRATLCREAGPAAACI